MRSIIHTVILSLGGALIAGPALAGGTVIIDVPEPSIFGLFAAGAVGVLWLKHRNRK